jgi:hypothetical protein
VIQAQGALDYPAAGKTTKMVRVAAFDDLYCHVEGLAGPVQQRTGIAAAGPYEADPTAGGGQLGQQRPGTVTVLHVGRSDQHADQQPKGVHGDVPLAAGCLASVQRSVSSRGVMVARQIRADIPHAGRTVTVVAEDDQFGLVIGGETALVVPGTITRGEILRYKAYAT